MEIRSSISKKIKERIFYKYLDFNCTEEKDLQSLKDNLGDKLIIHDMNFGYDKEMYNNIYFYKINKSNVKFNKEFKYFEKEKMRKLIVKLDMRD